MLAFSIDYYGIFFRATQSVELFCTYTVIYKTRVRSLIFRLATLAYHRRILFTDFFSQSHKSWHDNWATLSTYFKYPEAVRRLIYTTNAIEGFNRQLRKVTKSKTVFPSDDSLLKMLYLATMDITKKWTGHRQDWGQIHSQLEIYFEERLIGRNL